MKPIDAAIASWITHCIKIISYSSYLVNTTNTYANLSPSKSNFLNELIATRMFYPATKRIKDNSKLMNPWLSVNLIKCSSWLVISPTGVSLAKQVKKIFGEKTISIQHMWYQLRVWHFAHNSYYNAFSVYVFITTTLSIGSFSLIHFLTSSIGRNLFRSDSIYFLSFSVQIFF